MNIPLADARRYALKILNEIEPLCERVAVAGSVRRCVPCVHDIDLVVIPRDVEALKKRCLDRCRAITRGDSIFAVETPTGVQVEFYFAHAGFTDLAATVPSNWGSVLLQRTGPVAHNIKLVERAKALGLKWALMSGVIDSGFNVIASESEESIFAALQLDYVPPEGRDF